jgi:hypothetical protein
VVVVAATGRGLFLDTGKLCKCSVRWRPRLSRLLERERERDREREREREREEASDTLSLVECLKRHGHYYGVPTPSSFESLPSLHFSASSD